MGIWVTEDEKWELERLESNIEEAESRYNTEIERFKNAFTNANNRILASHDKLHETIEKTYNDATSEITKKANYTINQLNELGSNFQKTVSDFNKLLERLTNL